MSQEIGENLHPSQKPLLATSNTKTHLTFPKKVLQALFRKCCIEKVEHFRSYILCKVKLDSLAASGTRRPVVCGEKKQLNSALRRMAAHQFAALWPQAHLSYDAGQWSEPHRQANLWATEKSSNMGEIKHFCKEEWANIPPQWSKTLISYCKNGEKNPS